MTTEPTPDLRSAALAVALQRAGALSTTHMTYADLARCVIDALADGRDDLGAPAVHAQHATPSESDGARQDAIEAAHVVKARADAGLLTTRDNFDTLLGEGPRVRHGRHCPCSACAAEDWTNPDLAPCDYHGVRCVYDPRRFAAPAPDSTDPLQAAVRDWIEYGAGDGTEAAEAESQRLLEAIVAAYSRSVSADSTAGLDVERLAKAIQKQKPHDCDDRFLNCAAEFAREYAALGETADTSEPGDRRKGERP